MRDRLLIIAGLVAFVAVATFPVWYDAVAGTRAGAPAPARPSAAAIARVRGTVGRCVAPRDFMRTSHMRLLAAWRDDVVRQDDRVFVAYDDHRYEKNLTATCFGCHESKAQFCDRCHDYAGVKPTCPDCHVTNR